MFRRILGLATVEPVSSEARQVALAAAQGVSAPASSAAQAVSEQPTEKDSSDSEPGPLPTKDELGWDFNENDKDVTMTVQNCEDVVQSVEVVAAEHAQATVSETADAATGRVEGVYREHGQ